VQDFVRDVKELANKRYAPREVDKKDFSDALFGDVWRVMSSFSSLMALGQSTDDWCWFVIGTVGLRGRGRASDSIGRGSFVTCKYMDSPICLMRVESVCGVKHDVAQRDMDEIFVTGKVWRMTRDDSRVGLFRLNSSLDVVRSGQNITVRGKRLGMVAIVIHVHRCVFFFCWSNMCFFFP
jgi:hypothetical protein